MQRLPMTTTRQDEQSPSASPVVAGSASQLAIYNCKADKWRESGPLISVNWMWRHFFTAVRYGTSLEDIRGGCWIGIFNVLITGRVGDDRSCSASTSVSTRAGGRWCERGAKEPLCSTELGGNKHIRRPRSSSLCHRCSQRCEDCCSEDS